MAAFLRPARVLARSSTHAGSPRALAVLTFGLVRGLQRFEPRLGRRIPAPFFAVLVVTLIVWLCGLDADGNPFRVQVVRDIEPLSRKLPGFSMPSFDLERVRMLIGPALAIGLMGAVEAIAIGKTLAARAGHRFDATRQLLGEGFCNVGAASSGFAASVSSQDCVTPRPAR